MLMAPVGALAAPNTGGHKGGECDQWYTVKCGDTIGNIAWKFGVNSTELAQMNGLHNPNKIYVGQTLCIPEGYGHKDGWDDGKKDGWDDGKKDGWDDGKKDGWDDGKQEPPPPPKDGKEGWDDGKQEPPPPPKDGKDGWDDGKQDGWDDGKQDGWDDGHKDGCQGGCDGGFKYTVKCGDTIGDIAWKFGVNSTKLAQVNGLHNPNKIFVGQQLWIP
jgi:LysM repeat protein